MPLSGLSIFPQDAYRDAVRELFDGGEVEGIEWSVDCWRVPNISDETKGYLSGYGAKNNLIGHGVHYPLLSAAADDLRAAWTSELREDVKKHTYDGLSVHFGFSTGWRIREGAPLPVPLCDESLSLGKRALREVADVVGCRVGIENLALAFSQRDVADQGKFIDAMLAEFDGYLLLDLHNIYCQSVNFNIPMLDLVKTYPLHRVHEIHVSGGSWSEGRGRQIRRDTHNGAVPQDIIDFIPQAMSLCPNVKYVLLERLPQSFRTAGDAEEFREDYRKMKHAVASA